MKSKRIFIAVVTLFSTTVVYAQGAFINEFSNGASGSKEYVEMVVDGNGSCTVDLRGFIFDDNNGDFGSGTGMGIASGHARFKTTGPWGAIPSGSIILLYNSADKNASITLADDPYDANSDRVYVIPSNNNDIEYCTTRPTTSDAAYSPCTYSTPVAWTAIGFANTGDAAQTRSSTGNYFHGISYDESGGSDLTGGPDNLELGTTGTNRVYFFNGTNYRSSLNWSNATASAPNETPGTANNAANLAFINGLTCVLPVEFLFITVKDDNDGAILTWGTASETNCSSFTIQRAGASFEFQDLNMVYGHGTTNLRNDYQVTDLDVMNGINYYRLKQTDFDGNYSFSSVVALKRENNALAGAYYNGNYLITPVLEGLKLKVYDLSGKLWVEKNIEAELTGLFELAGGYYIAVLTQGNDYTSFPIVIFR